MDKQRSTAQKIFYPINMSFAFVDSTNTFNTNQRMIKPNAFLEKLLQIKLSSPEDNLKIYRYPVWLSHIILFAGFILSSFIPFYFMAIRSFSTVEFDFVLCWMFWIAFFLSLTFVLVGWRKMEKNRQSKRSINVLHSFQLRAEQIKQVLFESVLLFAYFAILFYVSDHIENIFVCYVHAVAIVFRFCFKLGRAGRGA